MPYFVCCRECVFLFHWDQVHNVSNMLLAELVIHVSAFWLPTLHVKWQELFVKQVYKTGQSVMKSHDRMDHFNDKDVMHTYTLTTVFKNFS